MNNTLHQIRQLEKYISTHQNAVDELFASTIAKLYEREQKRLQALLAQLRTEIDVFERTYAMDSAQFEKNYEEGTLGDEIDFIEWSATLDMLRNAQIRLETFHEAAL